MNKILRLATAPVRAAKLRWTITVGAVTVAAAVTGAASAQASTGETTGARPGLVFAGGALHTAWTGTDASHHINIAQVNLLTNALEGKNTLTDTAIGGTGPALGAADISGVQGLQAIVAWAGTDSGHHIWIGRYTGTTTLACHSELPQTTANSPFLTNIAFDGTGALYLLWTGTDSAHHINVAQVNLGSCTSSGGIISLGTKVTLTDTAAAGPAAAGLGGTLYVYWPGTDSGHHIWAGAYAGTPTLSSHTEESQLSTTDLGARRWCRSR